MSTVACVPGQRPWTRSSPSTEGQWSKFAAGREGPGVALGVHSVQEHHHLLEGGAVGGALGPAGLDERPHAVGHAVGPGQARALHKTLLYALHRLLLVGPLPRVHLPQDDCVGVDVHLFVVFLCHEHFGRHPAEGAHLLGEGLFVHVEVLEARHRKVGGLADEPLRDEDVVALQVAVEDAQRVQVQKSVGDLECPAFGCGVGDGSGLGEVLVEVTLVGQLGHDVDLVVAVDAGAQEVDHVRVPQRAHELDLVAKELEEGLVAVEVLVEALDGDELVVVKSLVDGCERAGAKHLSGKVQVCRLDNSLDVSLHLGEQLEPVGRHLLVLRHVLRRELEVRQFRAHCRHQHQQLRYQLHDQVERRHVQPVVLRVRQLLVPRAPGGQRGEDVECAGEAADDPREGDDGELLEEAERAGALLCSYGVGKQQAAGGDGQRRREYRQHTLVQLVHNHESGAGLVRYNDENVEEELDENDSGHEEELAAKDTLAKALDREEEQIAGAAEDLCPEVQH
mmetsp:Transcript_14228/g.56013  ORF Transcript_14228/g.56013 Transcript_14228/m.56013 type:complete len:508 (-) Transcript_14228:401-1924(-)